MCQVHNLGVIPLEDGPTTLLGLFVALLLSNLWLGWRR